MEAGSFGKLASVTSLGLLADRVVLAVERLDRSQAKVVPMESRGLFKQAEEFLSSALDGDARRELRHQITRRAVRSENAFNQAVEAAKVIRRGEREEERNVGEFEPLLRKVHNALASMEQGRLGSTDEREQVQEFFTALSDVMTVEHDRLSLRTATRWPVGV